MVGNALASLSACTLRGGGDEGRSATGLVTVECHRDAIDQHLGVSFNDYANSMTRHRASAAVTLTGDGYTEDFGASRCADDDSTMARGVVQANYAVHVYSLRILSQSE